MVFSFRIKRIIGISFSSLYVYEGGVFRSYVRVYFGGFFGI